MKGIAGMNTMKMMTGGGTTIVHDLLVKSHPINNNYIMHLPDD